MMYVCFKKLWLLTSIIAVNSLEYYTEQPSFLPSCKINEPGFTKCSTNSAQKLMDQIVIGIPEVTATFGSIDPLHVRDIIFKQDNNQVATIAANLSNIIIHGFSKVLVKENRVSKKDYSWLSKIFLPTLRLEAQYKMAGRILLIPLNGVGKMFIEIENSDIIVHTKTRLYERGDFTFDNVTSIRVDVNMTRIRTHFSNLFNSNSKEIERSTNDFFNANWRDLYEALKPIIIQTIEDILFDVMQKVFNLIPANFFISDIPTSTQLYGKANEASST